MKKYKQVLAALLAMNLTVYVMPTGMVKISASVESQSDKDTAEETKTDSVAEVSAAENEDTAAMAEASSGTEMTDSEETAADTEEISDNTEIEITDDDMSAVEETPDVEISDETDSTEENLFSDGSQMEEVEEKPEEDTVENVGDAVSKPRLANFKNYTADTKTIEITDQRELILLSNCEASEIKDITINLQMSGTTDLTVNSKISSGTDISAFYRSSTESVSQSGSIQTNGESTVAADGANNEIQQEEAETESTDAEASVQEIQESTGEETAEVLLETPEGQITEGVQEVTGEQNADESQNDVAVQDEKATAEVDYTFQGIGSAAVPFEGTISGSLGTMQIDKSFFGGLSSKAVVNAISSSSGSQMVLTWCGDGTVPMIAGTYSLDDNATDGHTLPVTVVDDDAASATMGSLLGTVKASSGYEKETLKIGAEAVTYGKNVKTASKSGNSGLICETLESGTISLDGYSFPDSYAIESTADYTDDDAPAAGNAGGVIGVMKSGTTLEIKSAVTVKATVTSDNGNAGGLVGLMEQGAKLTTGQDAAVTMETNLTVSAGASAGGVAGMATDVVLVDTDLMSKITVNGSTIKSTGKNTTVAAGGFIGKYTLNENKLEDFATTLTFPNQIAITNPTLTVANNGLVGGCFGQLVLNGKVRYTISGTDESNKKNVNLTYQSCSAEAAGAIAGKVTSSNIASTLLIQNVQATATNSSANSIQRHGGLVGEVGTKDDAKDKAYLKVSNVEVKVTKPYAVEEDSAKNSGYGFGGVAGLLSQGSILQTENITVSTPDDSGNACGTAINRGGGLVGYAEKSVINLYGTTDLSGVGYKKGSGKNSNDPKTGWLVGTQDSALIYANGDGNGHGWKYIRGKESDVKKQAMNDIGNYGQIIRLHSNGNLEAEKSKLSSDLITIDETNHTVSYKDDTEPTVSGDTITVNSVDAFARLSIAWNTRGHFGGVTEIEKNTTPKSKNITLTSDVDLTGSGITGLSRDTYSTDDTYAGIFEGGNRTITLAIGETFGFKQDNKNALAQDGADGYGEVISAGAAYHGRQGIFAEMSTATIQNLTVNGKIWISNNGSNDILVGGIAAELATVKSKINISGVTAKEYITADGAGGSGLMLGGFFGGSYDNIEVNLNDLNTSNTAEAVISITGCPSAGTNDSRIIAGGVIGELGEQTFSINVNCLTVKGSITTEAHKSAYIGGLIGAIKGSYASTNHYIKISNVVFNDFKIEASNATDMCGGLFGSVWASVEVALQTPTDTEKYAVDVQNATINAPKAASVGGFAYRAGGKWEIQDRGINLNTFSISAKKDLGLLVCRGEQAQEQLSGGEKQIAALYLSTTKYWENAYKISEGDVSVVVTDANGVFDEFVAYTTSATSNGSSNILTNNMNGIISIATQDVTGDGKTTRIGVDPSNECTTYQNRTTYGQSKQQNEWSRYYYDLDQCWQELNSDSTHKDNARIDTSQELLVWSVYTYADTTLKKYFYFSGCVEKSGGRLYIGSGADAKVDADLDMKKYSYYPVNYSVGSVYIQHASIKFYNQEIENIESAKKSTQGQTAGDHTQHYTMHCGLFLSYLAVNNTTGAPLYLDSVILSGSIGKVNNATSGVLVADSAGGYNDKYSAISINNTRLKNLKVNGCGEEYAPLLVNRISGNLNLTVNTISTENYTEETTVASSLIGTVGSASAENITMNFQNIKLPDKKADGTTDGGIFSHATLLESYAYKKDSSTSNATYIFYYSDDWGEGKPHHGNVTYGKEITNSTEFAGIQKWYYDEKLHGDNEKGLVYDSADDKYGFDASSYLPYVYVSYNETECTHEIKVNQRVENILEGCGTYGHPYRITKAAEMNILSEYLSTGMPQKDWRVRVTKSQASVHTAKNDADYSSDEDDVVYQYDGNSKWVQVENTATDGTENWQSVNDGKNIVDKNFMLNYLLNAYYDIQGSVIQGSDSTEKQLILNDFKGFGTASNPFRGVITSSNNTTLVLKGDRTGNGLIPYSYGSVVKNLKISYQKSDENQGKTLTYETNLTSETYPKVAFGGVIGCVMGGDNIIDGVTVKMDDTYLTLSGEKSHLLQVGGYVGSVSGGGVIFRNMTDNVGLTNGKVAGLSTNGSETGENKVSNLYVNPYVGRVMDGFAFYEKTSDAQGVVNALENTNKNYKINTLNAGTHLDVNNNSITIKDAEGLLIFSAIVNSGAASEGNSLAYSKVEESSYLDTGRNVTYIFGGKYGKVRNAAYSAIGREDTDATDSIAEDQKMPGENNLPYLIQKYGKKQTAIFSATTDLVINLSGNESAFDMTNYGNGYQGIGARYVSNAVRSYSSPTPVEKPENLVSEVKTFNGNNKIVTVDMQVGEYTDDDFPTASVGGIFNVVRVSSGGTLSSVIIKQKANSTSTQTDASSSDETQNVAGISLTYYNSNGEKTDTRCTNKKEVGLGGFAGSLVGYTNNNDNRDITVESVQANGLTIDSPASAGGIFGNVGKPAEHKNSNIAILLQPQDSQMTYGVAFNNCSYQNLNVTGKYAAGGFAGYIGNTDQNPKSTVNENGSTQTTINAEGTSRITATDDTSWAGGLFGYVKTRIFINMTDEGEKKKSKITLQNVAVRAGTAVGGCIGYIDEKCYGIHNVEVKGNQDTKTIIQITKEKSTETVPLYAGGIVGYAKGASQDWTPNWTYCGGISGSVIENVQVNNTEIAKKHDYSGTNKINTNYISGGIIGQTAGGKTRMEDCTVTTSDIYGSVASGITGQTDSQMEFTDCEINGTSETSTTNIKGFSTAGGILGFWTGGQTVTIQGCKIQHIEAEGKDWGSGAIIGDADGGGVGILYLFDTSAQDSTVTAAGNNNDGGGRWPCVGTIIGNLRNSIKASNVLISDVTLTANGGSISGEKHGLLFGNFNNKVINIAGISIQNIPDSNKNWTLTGDGNINTDTNYIAFADYSGTSLSSSTTTDDQADDTQEKSQTSLAGNSNDLLGADYKDSKNQEIKTDVTIPYVVTSPKSTLALYESETSPQRYLYGDGVSWKKNDDGTFTVKANEICNNKGAVTNGHYPYNNINVGSFEFNAAISTYSANQTDKSESTEQETQTQAGDTTQTDSKATDFPVLQVSAGNTGVVSQYLDILTNGAFTKANSLNKKDEVHVTAKVDVYQESADGKFVKADKSSLKSPPAFKVTANAANYIGFETTANYDNDGKKRFNLLTVTFTEMDGTGTEHHYNVFVPVLVRRMLEMDFTATLTYGTDFRSSDYSNLSSHVLESFGSSITGYLNYVYNSAEGVYTDYGWESYINAGGDMMEMRKSIRFTHGTTLPKGTQLSLVDCRNGKVYYYTATGQEDAETGAEKVNGQSVEVPLGCFEDSDGNKYQEPSISELIKAEVSEGGSNPLFIEVDTNGKPVDDETEEGGNYKTPTVKIKNNDGYKYYRLADGTKNETGKYTITVPANSGNTSTIKENYYLVVTIPKTVDSENAFLNGSIQTTINSSIPNRIHYRKVAWDKDDGHTDKHNNSASTYLMSSGYEHSLSESSTIKDLSKEITMLDSVLKVDVIDKITFPNRQIYNSNDQLYLKFTGGLQKTIGDSNSASAEQFPSGTKGTVKFYVYTTTGETKTYYTYSNNIWEQKGNTEESAMSYEWISDGGSMELLLSEDGKNAVSMQGLRDLIKKSNGSEGSSTFYVEAVMDASIPGAGLDKIPESALATGLPQDYVKLTYSSQISTEAKSLDYSTNRASLPNTQTAYYRKEPAGVTLTYDADKIDQLGINLLDLQSAYLDAEKKNTFINTTATYDLSSMKNLESTLKNSTGIKFTLQLSPKNMDESSNESADGTTWKEQYQNPVTDADKYLSVELQSPDSGEVKYKNGTWTWTVPKSTYYDNNDKIKTDSVFDNGKRLTQAILLRVDVTNVEQLNHIYSNYKVVLSAEIIGADGSAVDGSLLSDNIIYTLAKIKPEFQ